MAVPSTVLPYLIGKNKGLTPKQSLALAGISGLAGTTIGALAGYSGGKSRQMRSDLDWVEHILHLEDKHNISIPEDVEEAYRKKQIGFDHDKGIFTYRDRGQMHGWAPPKRA